jgi:hypothetical protein
MNLFFLQLEQHLEEINIWDPKNCPYCHHLCLIIKTQQQHFLAFAKLGPHQISMHISNEHWEL